MSWRRIQIIIDWIGPEGNWIHKCYCCYTFFGTKEERSEHYLTVHPERVTCKLCGKKFTETSLYYKHVDRAHNRPDTTKRKSIKSRAHTKFVRDGERKERSAKYCDKCGKSIQNPSLGFDAHIHYSSHCRYFQVNPFRVCHCWTIMRNQSADSHPTSNVPSVRNHSAIAIHWNHTKRFTKRKNSSVRCAGRNSKIKVI